MTHINTVIQELFVVRNARTFWSCDFFFSQKSGCICASCLSVTKMSQENQRTSPSSYYWEENRCHYSHFCKSHPIFHKYCLNKKSLTIYWRFNGLIQSNKTCIYLILPSLNKVQKLSSSNYITESSYIIPSATAMKSFKIIRCIPLGLQVCSLEDLQVINNALGREK